MSKVVLITGAGTGIGASIARSLSAAGYRLMLTSTDGTSARAVAASIGRPVDVAAVACDFVNTEDAPAAVDHTIRTFGQVDIVVNNAAISSFERFADITLPAWDRMFDVNLRGAMLVSQAAAADMSKRKWGRIVSVASIVGIQAFEGRTAYGASKAAIMHLTRQMAIELAPLGITANSVAPGPIETDMSSRFHSQEVRNAFSRSVPVGRYGAPDEVAAAVEFFASERASYVTGQTLVVDGGLSTKLGIAAA